MIRDLCKPMEKRKNPGVSCCIQLYNSKSCYFQNSLKNFENVEIYLINYIFFFIISALDCDLKDLPVIEETFKQIRADNPGFF